MRRLDKPIKRVMIAGGGNIGRRLTKTLEGDYQVKLIDHNSERANSISKEVNKAIVLLGDAADGLLIA